MKTTRFEKFARRLSLAGSFILLGVFFQALVESTRDLEQPKSTFVKALYSGPLLLSALAAFAAFLKLVWKPLPLQPGQRFRSPLAALGLTSFLVGFLLDVWGRLALGRMFAVSSALEVPLHRHHRLVKTGPFAIVRHPMYLGHILVSLGLLAIWRNWAAVFLAIFAPTLLMRAKREEMALHARFGREWEAYASRVPLIVPDLKHVAVVLRSIRPHRSH